MAQIVGYIATSHGPQLHTTPDQWLKRVKSDRARKHPFRGEVLSFDELVERRRGEGLAERATPEAMEAAWRACHDAGEQLADACEAMRPDVAVIFGNDQNEIYTDELNPAFMVFHGEEIHHHPASEEGRKLLPPGIVEGESGHAPDGRRSYAAAPELARHIIGTLIESEFDVAVSTALPEHNPKSTGIGHAFGHIYRQVMRDRVIPNVPITQNTFFPPNQPKASRSYAFGKAVGEAIRSWPGNERVVVFGSGGMSHFVIDEEWDRRFMDAMRRKDADYLRALPLSDLQSGTSEMKSWISLAGAMEPDAVEMHELLYMPCYRSEAGTGTAQGMYYWEVQE